MKTGNDGYFGSPYRLAAMYTTNINVSLSVLGTTIPRSGMARKARSHCSGMLMIWRRSLIN